MLNVYPYRGRRRCQIVKPHCFVLSRGDAAGFTVHPKYKEKGRKICVIDTGARLFHYCNVKSKEALQEKYQAIQDYWSERRFRKHTPDLY